MKETLFVNIILPAAMINMTISNVNMAGGFPEDLLIWGNVLIWNLSIDGFKRMCKIQTSN